MEVSGRHLGASVAVVALANVMLAVMALVRESRLAALVGTTETADAFMLALYLVDLVANTILAGGITFAAVPVLSDYRARGDAGGFRRTLGAATGLVIAITLALCVAGWFVAPSLVGQVGAGLAGGARDLARSLLGYLLPSVPFFGLAALFSSALYTLERFAFPAFGPVVLNLVFLLGLALAPVLGVKALAIAFTLGTVAMFVMQVPALARSGFLGAPTASWRDPGLASMVRKSWPVMAGILLVQPGGVVERMLASKLAQGSIAGLSYAFKLSQFPVWVFSAAIGTVIFPALAMSAGRGDLLRFKTILTQGLTLTMFVCLPFTATFVVLAGPIVSLLFQYGAFGADSIRLTSGVLRTYALGLTAQGIAYLLVRALYSLGDVTTPMKVAAVSAAVTVVSDVFLVRRWGLPGLGLGASVGAVAHATMLGWFLSRRVGFPGKEVLRSAWRICLASSLLAAGVHSLSGCLFQDIGVRSLPVRVLLVGVVLAAGVLVYLAACYVLKLQESGIPRFLAASRGRHQRCPAVPGTERSTP